MNLFKLTLSYVRRRKLETLLNVLLLALGKGLNHPLALLGQVLPRLDRIPLFHRTLLKPT